MFSIHCLKIKQVVIPLRNQRRMKSYFNRGIHYLFKKNLLLTNSITSGGFMFLGDVIQQEFEYQSKILHKRYDWARAVRMFTIGMILGPMHHYYYIYLDKLLPKADITTVTKKIFCDQTIASPATIICFFYGMGVLENKPMKQNTQEIKEKFKYVYLGDCMFWPPIQFINFYYLPTHYRVFYINFATMLFNVFLSYMKHDFA